MSDTVKCKYCGEEIKAEALKCKHCGEWLVEQPKQFKKNNIIFVLALLIVIACSALIGANFTNFKPHKMENKNIVSAPNQKDLTKENQITHADNVAPVENIKSSSSNKNVNAHKSSPTPVKNKYLLQTQADKNYTFVCKDKDGLKCAYMESKSKKIITPFKYVGNGDAYTSTGFSEGYAKACISIKQVRYHDEVGDPQVMSTNKTGYINKDGKVVIPFKYWFGSDFKEGKANVCVDSDCHELDTIDKQGKVLAKNMHYR